MNVIPSSDAPSSRQGPAPAPQPGPVATLAQRFDDEIDVGKLFGAVWAGKYWILLFAVIGFGIGLFNSIGAPARYQADALVQLEARSGRLAMPGELRELLDTAPETNVEMQIIQSRMILTDVVADLNLDWRASVTPAPYIGHILQAFELPIPEIDALRPFARHGDRIELEMLQVPPEWVGQPIKVVAAEEGFRLTAPDGREVDGQVGERIAFDDIGFVLTIAELQGAPGREYTVVQGSELGAVNRVRENLTIEERGARSGMLGMTLVWDDRQEAVRILNAILNAYVRQNVSRSAAEAESSLAFIQEQLPGAEASVRAAERALDEFRRENASLDLGFDAQNLLVQIGRVEDELRELATREDELRQRYTPNHPTYRQLLQERARLENFLDELRGSADQLPEAQRRFLTLTREFETAQAIYNQFVVRAQEMQVLRASTVGNARIVDTAVPAGVLVPATTRTIGLWTIFGAMAGIAVAVLRYMRRKGIKTPEQLEQMGLSVMATVLYSSRGDVSRRRRRKPPILALSHPRDPAVEAVRSLRTSLHFGLLDARTRVLAVTSAAPGAGKSFTCVNLAVVTAEAGQRVCLVDADMRRGELGRYFGVEKDRPGLAQVLAGQAPLESVLVQGPLPGLTFLPSGLYPDNPSELLMRPELRELVARLSDNYDLAILDCPPALAVTDPVIIGRAAGASLIVVRHRITTPTEIQNLQKTLRAAAVPVAGAVLNGMDPKGANANYAYYG